MQAESGLTPGMNPVTGGWFSTLSAPPLVGMQLSGLLVAPAKVLADAAEPRPACRTSKRLCN